MVKDIQTQIEAVNRKAEEKLIPILQNMDATGQTPTPAELVDEAIQKGVSLRGNTVGATNAATRLIKGNRL